MTDLVIAFAAGLVIPFLFILYTRVLRPPKQRWFDPEEVAFALWAFRLMPVADHRRIKNLRRRWFRDELPARISLIEAEGTDSEYFDYVLLLNMRIVAHGPTEDVFTRENLQRTYGGRLTLLDQAAHAIARRGRE